MDIVPYPPTQRKHDPAGRMSTPQACPEAWCAYAAPSLLTGAVMDSYGISMPGSTNYVARSGLAHSPDSQNPRTKRMYLASPGPAHYLAHLPTGVRRRRCDARDLDTRGASFANLHPRITSAGYTNVIATGYSSPTSDSRHGPTVSLGAMRQVVIDLSPRRVERCLALLPGVQ